MRIKKFQEFIEINERFEHPDYEDLYDKLVNFKGKSDTLEGEILRAFSKLAYRFYNDGDLCNKDYGIETCGSAAIFLRDIASPEIEGLSDLLDQLFQTFNDEIYEDILEKIGDLVVSYIKTKVDDDNLTPNTNNLNYLDYKDEAEKEFGGKPDWYYRDERDDEDEEITESLEWDKVKSDILDLFNVLTYSVPFSPEFPFQIKGDNNGISFKFYGVNGYLSYLNLKQKKLLIKIDPDHQSAVEQKIWKMMQKQSENLDNGWFINVILT